jgi:Zn-dependent protease with chaperone function
VLLAAEGLALIAVAVVLAGPVPAALARAAWPARSPRAALVLWQAVGLGGGLAILGAGVTLAVSGLHRSWLGGVAALPGRLLPGHALARGAHGAIRHLAGPGPLGWAGVALTLAAGAWLFAVLVVSTTRLLLARREHRRRLDLLAGELRLGELIPVPSVAVGGEPPDDGREPDEPGADGGLSPGLRVRLLDHPLVAAYCLPGVRPRIVLSQGVLDVLSAAQLAAVVSHERAHARGQHDLVILPFRAWRQTFPFLPAARSALAAVELLVEMLADDTASRRCGPAPLLAALHRLADAAPGDVQVATRAARLAAPPARLPWLATAAAYLAALALVGLPPAILLAS